MILTINVSYFIEPFSTHSIDATVCRFLGEKFVASYPGTSYPIIYEPINKGRLTIWTGVSTLPTSEFRCHGALNSTTNIALDFAHFVNKLDWTFYGKFTQEICIVSERCKTNMSFD